MTAARKHFVSLVKMKQNPRGAPYPMSLRLLALYLEEWWATLSRFRVGAQRLRKSNKRKLRPLAASSAMALNPYALPLGHHRGATHDRRYYRLQTDIDVIST